MSMSNWEIIGKFTFAICGALFFGLPALLAFDVYFSSVSQTEIPFSGKSIAGAICLGVFGAWVGWCIADLVAINVARGGYGFAIAKFFTFWR